MPPIDIQSALKLMERLLISPRLASAVVIAIPLYLLMEEVEISAELPSSMHVVGAYGLSSVLLFSLLWLLEKASLVANWLKWRSKHNRLSDDLKGVIGYALKTDNFRLVTPLHGVADEEIRLKDAHALSHAGLGEMVDGFLFLDSDYINWLNRRRMTLIQFHDDSLKLHNTNHPDN